MNLKDKIEELSGQEKILYVTTAIDMGIVGVGYTIDWKFLFYVGCTAVLLDCYRGISLKNEKNELIRRENIQDKFGGEK